MNEKFRSCLLNCVLHRNFHILTAYIILQLYLFLFGARTKETAAGGETLPRRCIPPAQESGDVTGKSYIGARRRLMIIMSTPAPR